MFSGKKELLCSSGNRFTLEFMLLTQKGKKSKDRFSLVWTSHFSLGFTSFSILVASHFVRQPPVSCIYFPFEKLFSQKLFFSFIVPPPWPPLFCFFRSLAAVAALASASSWCARAPCQPSLPAATQPQPSQNLLVPNILSQNTPLRRRTNAKLLLGSDHNEWEEGESKKHTWSILLRMCSFMNFLGHRKELMKFVFQKLSLRKYPNAYREENSDYVTGLLALGIKIVGIR